MFSIRLSFNSKLIKYSTMTYSAKCYDDELDDGRSIIDDICEIFEETKEIKFIVSGFGQEYWPVSCLFDLSVIIEQLPEVMNKINSDDYNFSLDFYEQGIEREIIFKDNGDGYIKLNCNSRTDWKPNPDTIMMKKGDINMIISDLLNDFIYLGKRLCPSLVNHTLLKEWMGFEV
ncbi:hypothetical protein [Melghirimyces algeriensis]|uniref:Uncharacterized protein n=1 Tax=Melghirimyces algeriensis TaxID=910412 RepID=A0A521C220_9BACL|nr:hypothetical protein [Melghirimyces algeriensis]SMO52780.1 hypothetical protein SAMN06264849_10339 [Melghirimyces algeriensis]